MFFLFSKFFLYTGFFILEGILVFWVYSSCLLRVRGLSDIVVWDLLI